MKTAIQDTGIIVHTRRYSETSLILTWLTHHHGIITTMAKGALRKKQKNYPHLDLFYEARIQFSKSTSSQLHSLTEALVQSQNSYLQKNYTALLTASCYYDLISSLAEKDTPITELFELYIKAVHYLDKASPSVKILEHFERRLYQMLGLDDGNQPLLRTRQRCFSSGMPESYAKLMKLLKPDF
ncbi:MAG: DNA repair protein RecO [Verrucomicrobiota bacterium]